MPFDHIDARVRSIARVRPLYDVLLPAMGLTLVKDAGDGELTYYHEDRALPFFGLSESADHRPTQTRIAFSASSPDEVDRLAEIARKAGARNFEAPGVIPGYTQPYYATFFEDDEGNAIEICCRR
jgi:catechol 2,3-dioxygenase-like lactoylglutathione lyase family enzyme